MKTNKRHGPSYIAMFTLIIIIIALTGYAILQWFTLNTLYKQGQEDISDIKHSLSQLEQYACIENGTDKDVPRLQVNLVYPHSISDSTNDLNETIAIVQNANSQALNTINNYLVVFSILITVVVLIVPLFNYWFLQRDQVKRLDEQYAIFNEQFNNELDRAKKSIKQSIEVSYNVISGAMKDELGFSYHLIKPISESPKDRAAAHSINCEIYSLRKQLTCALKSIDKAIEIEPDNSGYYNTRVVLLIKQKRFEEALKDANKAIELDSTCASCYHNRSGAFHGLKRYKEALKDADKAIELEPNNASYYDDRGITLLALKRYKEALADEDKAIEFEPDNKRYISNRDLIKQKMNTNI